MSTRSNIGIEHSDGTVIGIYCHSDGYVSHHGPILLKHYNEINHIEQLMELGDLSILGPKIGDKHDFNGYRYDVCTAYGRDRGELIERNEFKSFRDFDKWADNDYAYCFRSGGWQVRPHPGHWRSLSKAVQDLEKA